METERNPEPRWKRLAKATLLALRGGATRAVSSQITAAQDLIRERRYAEAIEIIEQAVKASPEEAAFLLFIKAGCLSSLGDERGAEEACKAVLRIDPAHAGAAKMLGRTGTQGSQERRECSVPNGAGEEEDPADAARHLLRDELIRKGREAEAAGDNHRLLALLNELIEIERPHATGDFWRAQLAVSYAWRAATHAALGSYEQAIEDCRTCQGIDPTYWKVDRILEAAEEGLNHQAAEAELRGRRLPDEEGAVPHSSAALSQPPLTPFPTGSTAGTLIKGGDAARDRAGSTDAGELPWRVGQIALGAVEIRKVIDRGGVGTVYCGWDRNNNRAVALKTVKFSESDGAVAREQLRKEGECWYRLDTHPRIVQLYGVLEADRHHRVLVMEYVAALGDTGPTLDCYLKERKQLSTEEAARIAAGICEAMEYAQEKVRLVHRDLKPANVFITTSGDVKVGDFGLAIEEGCPMGDFAGTPEYAAPEQWDPEARVTPAADLYAIGEMLFEMICARPPIQAPKELRSKGEIARLDWWRKAHREQLPPDPASLCPGLPPELSSLILRCLEKDPRRRRPPDFAELGRMLSAHTGIDYRAPTVRDDEFTRSGVQDDTYFRALTLHNLGFLDEALSCLNGVVTCEPFKSQRSDAWSARGRVLAELGRWEEARDAARRALKINTNDSAAQQVLATALHHLGSHKEALAVFDRLIEARPDSAKPHVNKGVLLFEMGDVEGAASEYEIAASLKSDEPAVWDGLGCCAETAGDLELAVQMYDQALELDETFIDSHAHRARVLKELDRREDIPRAVEQALGALGYNPDDAVRHGVLGFTFGCLGCFEEAVVLLMSMCLSHLAPPGENQGRIQQILERSEEIKQASSGARDTTRTGSAEAARQLYLSLESSINGRTRDAVARLEKLLEHDPRNGQACLVLAALYNDLGRYADATDLATRAARLNVPAAAEVAANIENQGLFAEGDQAIRDEAWDRAISFYERALEKNSRNSAAWTNLGAALMRLKRFEKAEMAARKAIDVDPRNADAHGNLGVVLAFHFNRRTDGMNCFLRALEINPNHPCRSDLDILRARRTNASSSLG